MMNKNDFRWWFYGDDVNLVARAAFHMSQTVYQGCISYPRSAIIIQSVAVNSGDSKGA